MNRSRQAGFLASLLTVICLMSSNPASTQTQQNLPDAPVPKTQPGTLPQTGPTVHRTPEPSEQPQAPSNGSTSGQQDQSSSGNHSTQPPPPMPPVKNAPRGATGANNPRDQIMSDIRVNVNLVVVPVTVKDSSGHLVDGLTKRDFAVYEDGVPQNVSLFTSDPFPLSIAVLIDTGMSDKSLRKVQDGLDALQGAVSPYDEVAVYTYAGSVQKVMDFNSAGNQLSEALNKVKERKGREGGFSVAGGPMNAGPSVNGHPLDPSQQPVVPIVPKETRALNDAVLAAALDLAKTDKAKRRVILIISDGKESNSTASYSDVLKVLLSHEIMVYGLGVDAAALPVYRKLETLNIPGTGTGNILPKYASATGGQIFPEFSRSSIQSAYADITGEARNQYTLGYTTRSTLASNYREIEVRIHRPGLKVYAKTGYYPLPPERP